MWVTVWLALLLVAAVTETTTRLAAAADDGHPAAAEMTMTASTTTAKMTASPYSWKVLDDCLLLTLYVLESTMVHKATKWMSSLDLDDLNKATS